MENRIFCGLLPLISVGFFITIPGAFAEEQHVKIAPLPAFVIYNDNDGPLVQLNSLVKIEQSTAEGWKPVLEDRFFAIDAPALLKVQDCLNLSPNSSMTIGPWGGSSCSQGACDNDVPLPDGTYRYVVESCDGKQKFVSQPFEKTWDYTK